MSKLINIEIALDDPGALPITSGQHVKGVATLSVKEDLNLRDVSILWVFEARGKWLFERKAISRKTLQKGEMLFLKGQTYEFPFSLEQQSKIDSYKGLNISFSYKVEVSLEVVQDEASQSLGQKLKALLKKDKRIRSSLYIQSINEHPYLVKPLHNQAFPAPFNWGLFLLIGALFAIVYYLIIQDKTDDIWLIGFIGCILPGVLLQQVLFRYILGKFYADVYHKGNGEFGCRIQSEKKWKMVSGAICYFQIIEKVIDRRGTSDTTYKEILYRSNQQSLSPNESNQLETSFNYPEKKNLASITLGDMSIEWALVLEVKTYLGLILEKEVAFTVKKGIKD